MHFGTEKMVAATTSLREYSIFGDDAGTEKTLQYVNIQLSTTANKMFNIPYLGWDNTKMNSTCIPAALWMAPSTPPPPNICRRA